MPNCPFCQKQFVHLGSKNRHVQSEHYTTNRVFCAYCLKCFRRKENCKKHQEKSHKGLNFKCVSSSKQHVCPHCNQEFTPENPKFFFAHVSTCFENPHTKKKVTKQCKYCQKTFYNQSGLNLHTSRFHKMIPKPTLNWEPGEFKDNEVDIAERELSAGILDSTKLYSLHAKDKTWSQRFKVLSFRTLFTFSTLSQALSARGYVLEVIRLVLLSILKRNSLKNTIAIQLSLDSPNYLDHPITTSVQQIKNFSIDNFLFQVSRLK